MTEIAIIGMSCRFPGADDLATYWQNLCAGTDSVGRVPVDRWNADAWHSADEPGRISTTDGGFLSGIDEFDSDFFGISAREASSMDPQQRLVLEVAWNALEDAGIPAGSLAGSATGVFLGASTYDHGALGMARGTPPSVYNATGAALSVAANRVSYCLDLRGPSMTVDTACSSSLVAVHQAVRSLLSGETELALAGGVNLILSPSLAVNFSAGGLMAPDGRCKTFDHRADGYVRGEGSGFVVLKRLSEAVTDGDRIYAVIAGTAVNQDGKSNGIYAPNRLAQEAVLRAAYRRARIDPSDVDYVEAHGTGTALGDPIEVGALHTVLGTDRRHPLRIGSVKSNLGHLEAAAGISGLIKVALSLHHRTLPASINFERPNALLRLEERPIQVQDSTTRWPEGATCATAGVSSFGFGGTNAHAVLTAHAVSSAVTEANMPSETTDGLPWVAPLSARTIPAVTAFAEEWVRATTEGSPLDVYDAVAAIATRRDHHDYRAALVATTSSAFSAAVEALGEGRRAPDAVPPRYRILDGEGPVFVFAGQGGQWAGMGSRLADTVPAFRVALERTTGAVAAELGFPIWTPTTGFDLDRTETIQPALFAMQAALSDTLQGWGIVPAAVIGHSMGEVAAAYASGALTLADAAKVICVRSRLLAERAGSGGMLLAELSWTETESLLDGRADLWPVAENGPRETVLSGSADALAAFEGELVAREIFVRRVKVDFPAHNPRLAELEPALRAELAGLQPRSGSVVFVSTVLGEPLDGSRLDAGYWASNVARPVRFASAVRYALDERMGVLVELGPHPVLTRAVFEQVTAQGRSDETVVTGSLRRDDEPLGLARTLAELYVAGVDPDWTAIYPSHAHHPYPPYPWQRRRFPREAVADPGARPLSRMSTTVDGDRLLGPAALITSQPGLRVHPLALASTYLTDHRVEGIPLAPAALWLAAAAEAARERYALATVSISEVVVGAVCALPDPAAADGERTAHLELTGDGVFSAVSAVSGRAVNHARGRADADPVGPPAGAMELARTDCATEIDVADYYRTLAGYGLEYGPLFRGIRRLWSGTGAAFARITLPETVTAEAGTVHPTLLDACLQVLGAALPAESTREGIPLPVAADRVWFDLARPIVGGWCHAVLRTEDTAGVRGDLTLFDDDGEVLIAVRGLRLHYVGRTLNPEAGVLYSVRWQPAPESDPMSLVRSRYAVVGYDGPGRRGITELLRGAGHDCVIVDDGVGLRTARDTEGPFDGVIVTSGLDTVSVPVTQAGVAGQHLVEIVRAFDDEQSVTIVTRGAHSAGGTVGPVAAAFWGVGRCLATERPELRCTLVDLDAEPDETLVRLLNDPARPMEVCLREGRSLTPHLVPTAAGVPAAVRADRSYLITGGLGVVGLRIATRLVELGARHLVLVGRSAPKAAIEHDLDKLRATGASVQIVAADVTDRRALAELVNNPARPPLAGVVHAAGVLDDALLADLDPAAVARVAAPKVLGGWWLHELTSTLDLDFFVLCSSLAGLLGSPGQAAYAAANATLDALAEYRRARGLPAVSIAWGPWTSSGLVSSTQLRKLAVVGVPPLSDDRALELFEAALVADAALVAATAFDPLRWRSDPARWTVHLPGQATEADAAVVRGEARTLILAEVGVDQRRAVATEHVCRMVATALGDEARRIDPTVPLQELGFDSLMAMQLRSRIEDAFDLRLSAAVVFSYPTVEALAGELLDRIGGLGATDPEAESPVLPVDLGDSADPASALSALDDDALGSLIEQQLQNSEGGSR